MKFEDLMGARVGFCGVDNNAFCIVTMAGERLAFEAIEGPDDGYRSCLQEIKPVPLDGLTFFSMPVAVVTIEANHDLQGEQLVDDSGHVWLRFGTDHFDDYYPSFTFVYDPPKDATPDGSVEQGRK